MNRLVILGDSIAYGIPKNHLEMFEVTNYAVCGDETVDCYKKLSLLPNHTKAEVGYLLLGTNDLLRREKGWVQRTDQEIAQVVQAIASRMIQEFELKVLYFQEILPVHVHHKYVSESSLESINQKIGQLNHTINNVLSTIKQVIILPTQLFITDGKMERSCTTDGIHLSEKGYLVLLKILKSHPTFEKITK